MSALRAPLARSIRSILPLAIVACAQIARAQTPQSPAASQPTPATQPTRIIRIFDFEEPQNPELVPRGWLRAQSQTLIDTDAAPASTPSQTRPGFPDFNRAEFDFTTAHSGSASVRLPTQGGSTSLRLQAGEVAVFPDADYVVNARIRTTDLKHARAFLTCRLLDQRLVPIPNSEVRSRPIVSANDWAQVAMTIGGRFGGAAWLQIDLELLQPSRFQPAVSGPTAKHFVEREDIKGSAWFDDVTIQQAPRARLWTDAPGNLLVGTPGQAPILWMMVRDLMGQPLTVRTTIYDVAGAPVDTLERTLDGGSRPVPWTPRLPGFGWYRATMQVWSENAVITQTEIALGYMPSTDRQRAREAVATGALSELESFRFGLIAEDLPERLLHALPGLIGASGTGFVTIPAFDPETPRGALAASVRNRSEFFDRLADLRQQVTLSVPHIPAAAAQTLSLDPDDALGWAEKDPAAVVAYLEPTLDIYGQRLLRYQLGPVGDVHAPRRNLSAALSPFERGISRLVPAPMLSLSWRADFEPPSTSRPEPSDTSAPPIAGGPLIDGVALLVPAAFPPAAMHDLAQNWRRRTIDSSVSGAPVEVTIIPQLPDDAAFGPRAGVVELMRRGVEFWAAFGEPAQATPPARFALRSPWLVQEEGAGPPGRPSAALEPRPQLIALRTLAARLGGRRVVSTMPAPPGIRAYVLAGRTPGGQSLENGCVVAWNESATGDAAVEVAVAAPTVVIVDAFGNERTVQAPAAVGSTGVAPLLSVPVTDMPIFIEGVDPYLAQFIAGFRVEPAYVQAIATEHDLKLKLSNPWPVRISGKIQMKEPDAGASSPARGRSEDWTITPRGIVDFAIGPGQTIDIPITVAFSASQLAGRKDFVVVARVQADRAYPPIRLKSPVEVGLPTLDLTPELVLAPNPDGPDVIVTATVTNKDSRPRSLRLESGAYNQPSQQLQISDLLPGQTTLRRFVLRGAAKELSGRRVVISLSDAESPERLNKAVPVP